MIVNLINKGIVQTERAVYTYDDNAHVVYKWARQAGIDNKPVLLEKKVVDLGAMYDAIIKKGGLTYDSVHQSFLLGVDSRRAEAGQ